MDIIKNAFIRLVRKPARSLLVMLGVCVSVFSITVIKGVSSTGKNVISTQLNTMGLYGMSICVAENSNFTFSDNESPCC